MDKLRREPCVPRSPPSRDHTAVSCSSPIVIHRPGNVQSVSMTASRTAGVKQHCAVDIISIPILYIIN